MLTMQRIYDIINELAPFDTQEGFDNSGLLLGDPSAEITGIHVALDVTQRVLDEAAAAGANLIVTHHPLMFSPIRRLVETDYEARLMCRMIRSRMALIAAHTNLDSAPGGVCDTLALRCGLTNISGTGYLRTGYLPRPMTGSELAAHVSAALNTVVRPMGASDSIIRRVAVSSGAGGEFWEDARLLGAGALITGEIKHHHALALADAGMLGLEAGHLATEVPGIFALADALQNALNGLQYGVCVSKSQAEPYAPPARP